MKRLALLLLATPAAALGDDPFACVDSEFVDAFLGNEYLGEPTYSTELPESFAVLNVPESFVLIKSQTNAYNLSAVYKTTDSAETALAAAVDQVADGEWRDLPDALAMSRGGFQTNVLPKTARLCRDTEPGLLTVNARDSKGQTYLSYSVSTYSEGQTCNALESQSAMASHYRMRFRDALPELRLPDDVPSSGAGSGGSGGEYHSRVIVNTSMTRDSLVNYLGEQITKQGWIQDSRWSGNFSAGSIWSKPSPEGESMIGVLNAYGESGDTYHVRFGVSPAKTGSFSNVSIIGNAALQPN